MEYEQFVKSEWEKAFAEDFSFLRSIPSSKVLPKIALIMKHKELFTLDFMYKMATDRASIPKETIEEVWRMYNEEKVSSLSYKSVNHIKSVLKHYIKKCHDDEEKEILEKAQTAYEKISTPKAKDTRKAFFPIIEKAFNAKPKNDGGGCWSIPTPIKNRPMRLVLDFGGRFSTMRYWIDVFPDQKPDKIVFTSYEKIMGFSEPDWDLMRSDTLEQNAKIFIETVNRTIQALKEALK